MRCASGGARRVVDHYGGLRRPSTAKEEGDFQGNETCARVLQVPAWFAHFAHTREVLDWRPQQARLVADLDRPQYFQN